MKVPALVQFPDETLRSGELLNMIVAVIDSTQVINLIGASPLLWLGNHVSSVCVCVCVQLQELMCHVMMGNLVMFRKDSVLNILSKKLGLKV